MEKVDLYFEESFRVSPYWLPIAVAPNEEKPKDNFDYHYKKVCTIGSKRHFYVMYYQYLEGVFFNKKEAIKKAKIHTEIVYQDYKDNDPDATDEIIREDAACYATIYEAHLRENSQEYIEEYGLAKYEVELDKKIAIIFNGKVD